jgi:hypothetical protein
MQAIMAAAMHITCKPDVTPCQSIPHNKQIDRSFAIALMKHVHSCGHRTRILGCNIITFMLNNHCSTASLYQQFRHHSYKPEHFALMAGVHCGGYSAVKLNLPTSVMPNMTWAPDFTGVPVHVQLARLQRTRNVPLGTLLSYILQTVGHCCALRYFCTASL